VGLVCAGLESERIMFPNAHSSVYCNEEGEVLGWDNTYYDEPDYDSFYDEWGKDYDDE
jgi:hypothetical protein